MFSFSFFWPFFALCPRRTVDKKGAPIVRFAWLAVIAALWTGSACAQQATNILTYNRPSPQQAAALGQDAARLLAKPPRTLEGETDLACMAVAVYHESRGESIAGQRAVASVVLQRTLVPERWGSRPCEVVRPVQFSFMTGRWTYPSIREGKPWETALRVALTIMLQGPDPEIMGADHYHTPQVFPQWRHAMNMVARIGNHNFYVDPLSVKITREHGIPQAPMMAFLPSSKSSNEPSSTQPGQYDWGAEGIPTLVAGQTRGLPEAHVQDLYETKPVRVASAPSSGGFSPVRGPDVDAIARAKTPQMGLQSGATAGRMGLSQGPVQVATASFRPLGITGSAP